MRGSTRKERSDRNPAPRIRKKKKRRGEERRGEERREGKRREETESILEIQNRCEVLVAIYQAQDIYQFQGSLSMHAFEHLLIYLHFIKSNIIYIKLKAVKTNK